VKRRFSRDGERRGPPPGAAPASRVVTSLSNPLIKDIRALSMRKVREQAGLFVTEGLKLVAEGVELGWPLRILVHRSGEARPLLARLAAAARRGGGEVVEVSQDVLEKVSRRDNPQTVLGVFEERLEALAAVVPSPGALWIGLDRVRDPGNLGTIVRTADAVGAEGVMLIDSTTDPFGTEAVRATMGSIFNVRLAAGTGADFLAWRRSYRGQVIGTHLAGATDYRDVDYGSDCLILMGNEQQGLPDGLVAVCDAVARIPMRGRADSLNLAMATGLMVYEAARARLPRV
jgi:TrmH family RNA methyltransferase